MDRVSSWTMRTDFAEMVNRVAFGGERLIVERNGKSVAALVSMDDLERLLELEDRADYEDAEKSLADMKRRGEKPIPWEQVKSALKGAGGGAGAKGKNGEHGDKGRSKSARRKSGRGKSRKG